jgi:hypothetical protein
MKRKAVVLGVVLLVSVAAGAVEGNEVEYFGGTVKSVQSGTVGQFDMSLPSDLTFQFSGGSLVIPYASIKSYDYSTEVAHHLGVAPAIAVGLIKKRQRRHYVRISYQDSSEVTQAVVFEVPKQMPRTLMAILQTRAPHGCKTASPCGYHQW